MYIVITGDIIGSRELLAKGIKRENFVKAVEEVNKACEDCLLVKFSLMRGDEIQGVVKQVDFLPAVVRSLRYNFLPAGLRIGIGVGAISTDIEENSWEMDGEAFYRAREALSLCDKNAITIVKTGDLLIEEAANALFTLLDALQSKWTRAQWEAVMTYEKNGTYKKAAQILKVMPQNVAKRCYAARWQAVVKGEKAIVRLLKFVLEGNTNE
ncbi:SatD family protein [Thermoanaerobacter sp. RKWS2]|uniref:SatD family protein n=1 Tax=Thermoanaerobacter sp. RKWS2 TaxID=2983842 RepID=UPI00224AC68C|nr:SatD family protein [Thermoanaerobacter sp. RKWS2]UZQ83877.1 SatD family protein [Thermoanaerobacter sp. RKWS2]